MIYTRGIVLGALKIIFILALIVSIEAVTVSPALCPTNKIAPHRRILTGNYASQRTFGAFYDLLIPDNVQGVRPSNLVEQPLADNPDDCGDIEDYDENDVGSATTESARKQGSFDKRFLFGGLYNFFKPTREHWLTTSQRPLSVTPVRHSRPPYWSGGFFDGNLYRPPSYLFPSDYVKPVHEDAQEIHMTYRPGVVGGLLGHVIGVTQVKPTNRPAEIPTQLNSRYINSLHFSKLSSQATTNSNRRTRNRKINDVNHGVLGSFVDLFFK